MSTLNVVSLYLIEDCRSILSIADGTERASKYRYPSPLRVMGGIARQTIDIAVRPLARDQANRASSLDSHPHSVRGLRSDSSPANQVAGQDAGLEMQDLEAGRSRSV